MSWKRSLGGLHFWLLSELVDKQDGQLRLSGWRWHSTLIPLIFHNIHSFFGLQKKNPWSAKISFAFVSYRYIISHYKFYADAVQHYVKHWIPWCEIPINTAELALSEKELHLIAWIIELVN